MSRLNSCHDCVHLALEPHPRRTHERSVCQVHRYTADGGRFPFDSTSCADFRDENADDEDRVEKVIPSLDRPVQGVIKRDAECGHCHERIFRFARVWQVNGAVYCCASCAVTPQVEAREAATAGRAVRASEGIP